MAPERTVNTPIISLPELLSCKSLMHKEMCRVQEEEKWKCMKMLKQLDVVLGGNITLI
jgi:hypothetical protein